MRFTLRQVEYFIAAAETGSITLASERIHISPSSVSAAISELEKEFKVKLFIRHPAQGLFLTPSGRSLLREAKDLIEYAEGLYTNVSDSVEKIRGPLSLGCMVTFAPMILAELTRSFADAYPETRLTHIAGNPDELIEGLRRTEIDIALTYDLDIPQDIIFGGLVDLPIQVMVSETHPLAQQTAISLSDLIRHSMILLDMPQSREYYLSLFQKENVQPLIAVRSAHQDIVRSLVANGHGYTLVNVRPRSDQALDGRKLVRIPFSGDHRPMRIGVARLKQLKSSRLIEAFEAHCKTFISNSYIPGMDAPSVMASP